LDLDLELPYDVVPDVIVLVSWRPMAHHEIGITRLPLQFAEHPEELKAGDPLELEQDVLEIGVGDPVLDEDK
jgi:hypothetical protein